MKPFISDIVYTFSAQILSFVLSFLLALFVPRVLGVEGYSYWQLFLFYTSYAGFFHLGLTDGIYLKYGGKNLCEISNEISGQFLIFIVYIFLIAFALNYLLAIESVENNRELVYRLIVIDVVLSNIFGFWIYLYQATGRIKTFVKIILFDKLILLFFILILIIWGINNYSLYIYACLTSKLISLLYCLATIRDFFTVKVHFSKYLLCEYFDNIRVGVNLLFANIASLLLIGASRFIIDKYWGLIVFGKVSLMLSVVNFFIVFLSQIGIVMFPLIKKMNEQNRNMIYVSSYLLIDVFFLSVLLFYLPINYILIRWLPQYEDSIGYLIFLLPICIFEGKNQILLNPYLKSYRKERLFLYANLLALAVSLICSLLGVYLNSINIVLLSILTSIVIKNIITTIYLNKIFELKLFESSLFAIIYVASFIFLNAKEMSILSFIVCLLLYSVFIMKNRIQIKRAFLIIKNHYK